jgi:hypothetical protein
MALPKTLTEAREALSAALERETALQTEAQTFVEIRDSLKAQLDAAHANATELAVKLEASKSEILQLVEENAALRTAATIAETKVTEAVASLGVPPVAISEAPVSAPTKAELWDEYHKLPVENRNAFYKANRETMRD